MKKIIKISICILFVAVFYGCEAPIQHKKSERRVTEDGWTVITIDSCEYIEVSRNPGSNNGYYSVSHKGNCRFCIDRNKSKTNE